MGCKGNCHDYPIPADLHNQDDRRSREEFHLTGQPEQGTGETRSPMDSDWFTSYELGFPLVSDEHDRPMHALVESFVDDQLEVHWAEVEEANTRLPPLIGQLQTMKEGWGDH